MRQIILIIVPLFLLIWDCSQEKQEKVEMQADHQMNDMDHSNIHNDDYMQVTDENVIYYTCPMEAHKAVHSSEPGKCPECGMALVAGVITSEENMEFYGCPMEAHSHVRSDKPGKCAECGMELKPMRLKKMDKM